MTITYAEEARRALATTKSLSEYLDVPTQRLAVWRMNGIGPKYFKLENGNVRYRWADVDAWLAAQESGGSAA